jgi:hypothetical protein
VIVTVRDGASNLVSGAQVYLSGTTQFGGSQSGATTDNGTITFNGVLSGGFNVSATDPATGLGGAVSGNVGVGSVASVTVRLQSFGSIAGIVFQPNGTTPAPGITVHIFGQVNRTTTTGLDGGYRFDIVPTSTYTVQASDSGGLRASASGVVVSSQGQIAQQNLTMIGLGTVQGLVSNRGSPAANVGVSFQPIAGWPFVLCADGHQRLLQWRATACRWGRYATERAIGKHNVLRTSGVVTVTRK